jgi:hypothetical protein
MAAENVAMAEFSGGRAPESKPSLTHSFARLRSVALARSCPAREHAEQGFGIERLLKPLQLILSHPQRLRLEAGSSGRQRSAPMSKRSFWMRRRIVLTSAETWSDAKPMKELTSRRSRMRLHGCGTWEDALRRSEPCDHHRRFGYKPN